jgi:carbon monoxide dehydrogenase subunit G
MADACYRFSKAGTGYDVTVKPASAPPVPIVIWIVGIYCGVTGVIAALGTFAALLDDSLAAAAIGLIFSAIFLGITYWGVNGYNRRRKEYREECTFSITPVQLRVADATLAIPDIHRFILRNHVTDQEQFSPAAGTVYRAVGLVAASQASGSAWKAKLARVSWRLDAETGGKAHMLGCGLDETTGHGLIEDVVRKIAEIRSA